MLTALYDRLTLTTDKLLALPRHGKCHVVSDGQCHVINDRQCRVIKTLDTVLGKCRVVSADMFTALYDGLTH